MGAECIRIRDAGVDRIQFDVMDGNFVPNLTFELELTVFCRKYYTVPFKMQLTLLKYNCETMLDNYVQASKGPNGGPGVVIVHMEANIHLHRVVTEIMDLGESPSVAINPSAIAHVLDLVDHVLVMTFNPGFGRQSFIPSMMETVRIMRKWGVDRGLDFDIEMDGVVKANWSIADCAEAGANCFIAGSGMFKYDDLAVGCAELRRIVLGCAEGGCSS